CERVSIDVAILERADNVLVIKGDIMWDDVGSWRALERLKKLDGDNNVIEGDVLAVETYESTIYNDSDGIVTTLGVSDLVIVRSGDIVMVAHKSRSDEMAKILNRMRARGGYEKYL
ncbi:MAG: mannose-1-phosphate guanylyltransferase/mannose-6-phosphate isomerase, partial [candidate division Zixibacteria bacterium]|nr:mannose-1-phosphate guanylyltransferase/mannose-6-phosphate isomerase [candidate division Zixibacteria bacterium]